MSSEYDRILQAQRETIASGRNLDFAWRRDQLRALKDALETQEGRLLEALREDLGKDAIEAYGSELGFLHKEIRHALRHLRRWMKPRRAHTELILMPGRSRVYPRPYGAVLILSPWNYPVHLTIAPLIGALAAGNTAVLKPSELAPATAQALAVMVADAFDPRHVALAQGEADVASQLVRLPFDKIFYTGSSAVGRKVLAAAADNLTPVTLELGGKSPALVDRSADLPNAARKILWGKLFNAGQTCVAPDYVLVDQAVAGRFVNLLPTTIDEFFPEGPRSSPRYSRIISRRHLERLLELVEPDMVVHGGDADASELYLEPTILYPAAWDSAAMSEEIFGPVLPVLPVADLTEGLRRVAELPKPLAAYLFAADRDAKQLFLRSIDAGGAGINTVALHAASSHMPFGGIGASGMGAYHGKAGFDCFTHYRGVLEQFPRLDPGLAYPNRTVSLRLLRRLMG